MKLITRFAPSPTGQLHIGHAYSALTAFNLARNHHGQFLLRIEDIDTTRCRPEYEAQIHEDLAWLSITYPEPVLRQSDHLDRYRTALTHLWNMGLLYPCTCTRRDIKIAAPEQVTGPDGFVYPGTCRTKPKGDMPLGTTLRLNMRMAVDRLPDEMSFQETGPKAGVIRVTKDHLIQMIGDVVLARKDSGTSYHLSVVLDDAHQDITHVVRGQDLFNATAIHVALQHLMNLPIPIYHHHDLIVDETGKRLAKVYDSKAIAKYRAEGLTPADLRALLGL